ncbi:DcrB-related protein [Swingsia samuiensis]|uniref:DUF1795 domain-containing protein n=1 Tax=Swingsia samuiensis TaxID=1293412 RepID=A0A4Y6UJG0_9PROT|nr:DcrB-related protein [Swingsia samuiensis]QDH17194.1 DUF1795 domain-containing protein [Swingsia samuiensis]
MSAINDNSTPLYVFNEGSVPADVPGTWDDQTLNVLRIKGDEAHAASLVISRDTLPVGVELPDYIENEIIRLKETLQDFELKARLPVDWADGPGEALLTRWLSEEGSIDQVMACRLVSDRKILIFTATHVTPMPSGTYRTVMRIINGFRPRSSEQIG